MLIILKKAIRLPLEIWSAARTLTVEDYSRQWLKLGLFSLLLSGFFSAVIVLARTPGVAELIGDPQFARRSLVLHVDLALVVWFYAFLAVLYVSLNKSVETWRTTAGMKLAITGVSLLVVSIFFNAADPVLSNYIPVLDHPVFLCGLALFGLGLVVLFSHVMSSRLDAGSRGPFSALVQSAEDRHYPLSVQFADESPNTSKSGPVTGERSSFFVKSARHAIRYAGLVVLAAALTFAAAFLITPDVTSRILFFELVMWGGGHILQFANVLGMITVWLILLYKLTGSDVVGEKVNGWLLAAVAWPAMASPVLMIYGTSSQLYYDGFTQLMRWFIFPVVTVYLFIGIRAIWLTRRSSVVQGSLLRNLYFNGFMVSALLTVTGFVLGAMIRTSSTLIPAHYHASLGAVTVAYMVMVFILMKEYGYSLEGLKSSRLVAWQPLLFGIGQAVFVIGFGWAGLQGMGRKMFGSDQSIHTVEAMVGLGLMSIGGLMAMAGGLLFIYIVVKSYSNGISQQHKQ